MQPAAFPMQPTGAVYNEDRLAAKVSQMAAQCYCFIFRGISLDEVLSIRSALVSKHVVSKTAVLKSLDVGCLFEIVLQDERLILDVVRQAEDRTGRKLTYEKYGG